MSLYHSIACLYIFYCIIIIYFSFYITMQLLISTLFPYTTLFRSYPGWPGCCAQRHPHPPPPALAVLARATGPARVRSEEHTSELQSHSDLVCRLLLEKKKINNDNYSFIVTTKT